MKTRSREFRSQTQRELESTYKVGSSCLVADNEGDDDGSRWRVCQLTWDATPCRSTRLVDLRFALIQYSPMPLLELNYLFDPLSLVPPLLRRDGESVTT